jgi:MFS family permease
MIMGIVVVLPVYLQTVLSFDALESGITMLPLSLSLFAFALLGASLTTRFSPKRVVQFGLMGMLAGAFLLIALTGPHLRSVGFAVALALVGAGNGLLDSQLGNVIMSSVPAQRGSEAGGLHGTAMNPGTSLGTALVGSILLGSLVGDFQSAVLATPALAGVSTNLAAAAEQSANFVTAEQVRTGAEAAGLSTEQVDAVVVEYESSQISALKAAFGVVASGALVALWYMGFPPTKPGTGDPEDAPRNPPRPPHAAPSRSHLGHFCRQVGQHAITPPEGWRCFPAQATARPPRTVWSLPSAPKAP